MRTYMGLAGLEADWELTLRQCKVVLAHAKVVQTTVGQSQARGGEGTQIAKDQPRGRARLHIASSDIRPVSAKMDKLAATSPASCREASEDKVRTIEQGEHGVMQMRGDCSNRALGWGRESRPCRI